MIDFNFAVDYWGWGRYAVYLLRGAVESLLIVLAVTRMAGPKRQGGPRRLAVCGAALCQWTVQGLLYCSVVVPQAEDLVFKLSFPFFAALFTGLTAKTGYFQRAVAAVLSCLAVIILEAASRFLWQDMLLTLFKTLSPGAWSLQPDVRFYPRIALQILLELAAFFTLRRFFPKLQVLTKRRSVLLLAVSFLTFLLTTLLIEKVISPSYYVNTPIRAMVFLLLALFVAAILLLCFLLFHFQRERQQNDLLHTANTLMARNYQELHAGAMNFRKNLHDFNHHLAAIRELSARGKSEEVVEYVDSLLAGSAKKASVCQSGSDIVDAIINCKAAQAQELGIAFRYSVRFSEEIGIDPVDICAVLANQIDNAFEACGKIEEPQRRRVEVELWQQTGEMVFFQVKNTAASDPFDAKGQLISGKKDASRPHGLGLQSIRDAAQKYHGALENTFENGWFTSTVFLCCFPGGESAKHSQSNEVNA